MDYEDWLSIRISRWSRLLVSQCYSNAVADTRRPTRVAVILNDSNPLSLEVRILGRVGLLLGGLLLLWFGSDWLRWEDGKLLSADLLAVVVVIRPGLPLLLFLQLVLLFLSLEHIVLLLLHRCEQSLPSALMCPVDVLLQVPLLVETHLALRHRTVERLFVCVHSEVRVKLFKRGEYFQAKMRLAVEKCCNCIVVLPVLSLS